MTDRLDRSGLTVARWRAPVPASAVWEALSDGWLYASWVVGASRVRAVDLSWPATGSRIHHSFGVWPAVISDETVVMESVPLELLVLRPKGWPAGEAVVEISLEPADGDGCLLEMVEDAVVGPGTLAPKVLRQKVIGLRNVEALRRLSFIARGRQQERDAPS